MNWFGVETTNECEFELDTTMFYPAISVHSHEADSYDGYFCCLQNSSNRTGWFLWDSSAACLILAGRWIVQTFCEKRKIFLM